VPEEPAEAVEASAVEVDERGEPLEVTAVPEDVSDADEFKPSAEDLVVTEDRSVFEVMDAADIEQIIDAMQGRLLDVSLYDFEQGGQRIVELSWKGVRETVQEMHSTGKCRIGMVPEATQLSTAHDDGEDWYEALVYAKDEVTGATFSGFAREPKQMRLRGGGTKFDKFAQTKAINKAERNALRKFIPERLAQTLIAQFLHDESRVRKLRSGSPMVGTVPELPPPVDTDEARALVEECDGIWAEIRKVENFAKRLTPANYHAYKVRSEARDEKKPEDVSRLVQFRDYLLTVLQELEEARDDG
jgi:hypothetical protein